MPPALPPDTLQDLLSLRDKLRAAAPKGGERGQLVAEFGRLRGCAPTTVYSWLKDHAGYATGRKRRSDAGTTKMPADSLAFISTTIQQSTRANGISTKPICVAMNIAHQNGMTVNVSSGRVAALLRANRLDVKTQASARNHQRLRSLHPNHVHQIDPSLCLVYYMDGQQRIMDEATFNKNKPASMDKVRLKVWRYVRYDHASSTLDLHYYEAAGENQASLFEFLLHTWGKSATRLSHGVPKMLLWDKGSANTSTGIKRLLDALGVHHETHATHHAWAKGGVESGNRIVERHFESRLRDEPVSTVEQLNASAAAWVRDYNANAMAHIDSRVKRDDGQSYVRDDLWSLIAHHPGALVEMPERAVCAWFMRGKEETRVIRDGRITFVHPQTGKSELYSLQPWAKDFANGEKVRVSPLLLGDALLRVEMDRYGQDPLHVDVQPERDFDAFGRPLSATLLGHEYKAAPHTAAQEAAKQIAATAYGPGTTLDEAERLKTKNVRPFQHFNDGAGIVSHTHLGKGELPARLLPAAKAANTADLATLRSQRAVRLLTQFDAAAELRRLGLTLTREMTASLRAWYPDGVPEDQLQALLERLTVRSSLRVVAGGAA
ncbi:MAG: transposase [Simplicispira sp.]|uniref:transposase n=1 Tax=Simplicispira sp. TaxID=2015802 RepID=UPI00258358E0|nr:transposase [Simplicispira sp.]MDD2691890.1 transposase [Simplicispira sp.]